MENNFKYETGNWQKKNYTKSKIHVKNLHNSDKNTSTKYQIWLKRAAGSKILWSIPQAMKRKNS